MAVLLFVVGVVCGAAGLPAGDELDAAGVNGVGGVPSAFMTPTVRVVQSRNAIWVPSGDQAAPRSSAPLVSGPYPSSQAHFCDRTLDALMSRAHALEASEPAAANGLWARIDHAIVRRAPVVPLLSSQVVTVTSTRTGNYQYDVSLGPLLAQAWVR